MWARAHTHKKAQLILSQSSIWLHPCTVQFWSLTCLSETRNMYCVECHQFTLTLLYVCTHLATVWYNRVQSPNAWCSSAWHFNALLPQRTAVFMCECCSALWTIVLCKVTSTVMFVHKMLFTPVSILPSSDGNIYKYMPRAFKHIFSISCGATFLAKRYIVAMIYGVADI